MIFRRPSPAAFSRAAAAKAGALVAFLLALNLLGGLFEINAQEAPESFINPICEGADPSFVFLNGHYVACFSDGNRGLAIHVSDRLTAPGPKHVVWRAPNRGLYSREIWAPELQFIDRHWLIYFAASDGQNKNHLMYALQSAGDDPLGPYTFHGPLYTGDDPQLKATNRWAIDLTTFARAGQRYAVWSGWQDERDLQHLFIAPMKDPATIAAPRVRLCPNDTYLWERVDEHPRGRGLAEGPEILEHGGRTFLIYSCSGSWQPSYKLGLLELKPGSDPMKPESWVKYPKPVFCPSASTWGVGHNTFVKSPDGTEDWIVYHAKLDRQDGWRRAIFAQPFAWTSDGLPDFGTPAAAGQPLRLPSGETITTFSGRYAAAFTGPADLAKWSYYGHHQFFDLENGALHLGRRPGQPINDMRCGEKLVVAGGRWTNFTVAVRMRLFESRGQSGLLFRTHSPFLGYNAQRGYFAGIAPGTTNLVLGFTDGKAWHEVSSVPCGLPPAGEYDLAVTARANEIKVSVNGHELTTVQDSTYAWGTVGVRVVDTHAAFSNFQITPLNTETAAATQGR